MASKNKDSTASLLKGMVTKPASPAGIKDAAIEVVNRALMPVYGKGGKPTVNAIKEAFKNFEHLVGGRVALLETLKHCPANSVGYDMTMKLVEDPEFLEVIVDENLQESATVALSVICSQKKIPFNLLIAAFRDAKLAEVAIEALIAVKEDIQPIVEQVAQDAKNRWEPCRTCKGTARIARIGDNGEWAVDKDGRHITQLCFDCRGSGQIYKTHDFQNRKWLLDFVRLSQKEPLIQNTIDNRSVSIGGSGTEASFENVIKSLDAMIRAPQSPAATAAEDIIDVQPENNSTTDSSSTESDPVDA